MAALVLPRGKVGVQLLPGWEEDLGGGQGTYWLNPGRWAGCVLSEC